MIWKKLADQYELIYERDFANPKLGADLSAILILSVDSNLTHPSLNIYKIGLGLETQKKRYEYRYEEDRDHDFKLLRHLIVSFIFYINNARLILTENTNPSVDKHILALGCPDGENAKLFDGYLSNTGIRDIPVHAFILSKKSVINVGDSFLIERDKYPMISNAELSDMGLSRYTREVDVCTNSYKKFRSTGQGNDYIIDETAFQILASSMEGFPDVSKYVIEDYFHSVFSYSN